MKLGLGFLSKFRAKRRPVANKQYMFVLAAFGLLLITTLLVVYSFSFLISKFDEVSGSQVTPPPAMKFDIQGFEKLNLTK
ncbi:MAG TPA: hypothetical protein VNK70_02965 [Candidatus Paceibacterota bacterium]|nr:hypothetical protein [Candidatus Paceibacterota bacterium]